MMGDPHPLLKLLGAMRDDIDRVCDMMEQLQDMASDAEKRVTPDITTTLQDPKSLDLVFAELPPERGTALATAFMLLGDLVPDSEIDAKRQAESFKKSMDRLYAVRKHLHTALDGVV